MKHKLVIEGTLKARCECGGWQYIGITPEASKAIEQVFHYHADFDKVVKKTKRKKSD